MQPLSLNILSANAFRVLGISGSATQAEIDAAARRMRIWSDPARIPSSPWDRPALGDVPRSKRDIELAVMLLQQPESRIQQRLLWYCGSDPPPALPMSGAPVNGESTAPLLDTHNHAVAAMHAAWLVGSDMPDAGEWRFVVDRFRWLHGSSEYAEWLGNVESAGDFEKRSSFAEQADALRAVSGAMIQGVAAMAQASFAAGDSAHAERLLEIVRESADEGAPTDEALGRVLDRVEDELDSYCRDADTELRDKLRTNRQDPAPFFDKNRAACQKTQIALQKKIRPTLQRFSALAAGNPSRLARGRSWVAELLTFLAQGWEWAGQFSQAIATLEEAEALADSSPSTIVAIEKQREECRRKLADQRSYRPRAVMTRPKEPSKGRWVWVLVALVGGFIRAITGSSTSSTPRYDPNTFRRDIPQLTPQHWDSFNEAQRRLRERQSRPPGSDDPYAMPRLPDGSPAVSPSRRQNPSPYSPRYPSSPSDSPRQPPPVLPPKTPDQDLNREP